MDWKNSRRSDNIEDRRGFSGTAADRMRWLNNGLQYGEINRCNTFN